VRWHARGRLNQDEIDSCRGTGPFHWEQSIERDRQYADSSENPRGYCPIHATGVKLPDDFVVTPLQFVD